MWNTNEKKPVGMSGYPTASTIPTYPAIPKAREREGWCQRNHKNKPQSNSVGAAALIFLSGGMFLAGPGKSDYFASEDYLVSKYIAMAWFIGGVIGAFIGAILCNRIQKRFITCFSAILVIISGILLITDAHSYDAMLSARFLNGIAVGLVFPLTFVLAGEEVVKTMRGMITAATESMCFSLGIFLQMIYAYVWPDDDFGAMEMMGLLSIIYGVIGFIIAFAMQIESPLHYLAHGQEEMAIDTLRRLQRPFIVTCETYEQFEEHKRYLADSKERTFLENAVIGLPALLKLCFYRSFTALTFSFYTTIAFTYANDIAYPGSIWAFYMYGLMRLIGTSLAVFTLDFKGRKPPMIMGFTVCCCLTFAIGGIFDSHWNLRNIDCMTTVLYILMIFQFFAGLSTASSSAYLSEAFPLAVKPYYIAITFIVEMTWHIIIFACHSEPALFNVYDLPMYFYTLGGMTIAFFAVALTAMPETKLDTLRESLTKFRKILN